MKTKRIYLRVTPEEKELIKKRAFLAQMSTSDYIVALAKDKPIIIINDVAKLIVEIIRVGTNINQIAHIANTQKYLKREHFEAVENKMAQIQIELSNLLKRIDRAVEEESTKEKLDREKENGIS